MRKSSLIKADEIDEFINNISRSFSIADTTRTNPEVLKAFMKYNRLEVYDYPGFKTIHVVNSMYPEGLRIGIGLFQNVISTLHYGDLVLSNGAARGDYNKKLTSPIEMPEDDEDYDETHVEPYHYDGDPNN